ncbi:MAG: hypothetical protein ABIQ56_02530 [Chitinophagaceae bacterium]
MSSRILTASRFTLILILSVAILSLNSCYTYRVSTHAQAGTEVSSITAHSYFWGLIQKPKQITTPNCDSLGLNGMAEVQMKTNFGYALLTIATLGIWSPMKVEWRCSKPCKKTDTL